VAAFSLIETTLALGLAATLGAEAPICVQASCILRHRSANVPLARISSTSVNMGCGGRSWWAHIKFIPINIQLTISKNQIEELMNVQGIGEKNFLKLKPQLTVGARSDLSGQQ
jgi:hypothetical protein